MRRSTVTNRHYSGRNEDMSMRRQDNRNAHYSGGGGGGGYYGRNSMDDGSRPHFSGYYNRNNENDAGPSSSNRSASSSSKMRNNYSNSNFSGSNFSNSRGPGSSSTVPNNNNNQSRMRHSNANNGRGGGGGGNRGWSDNHARYNRNRSSHHNGLVHAFYDSSRNHVIKEEKEKRSEQQHVSEEKHKLKRFEDWSEQISKGGKKYYYNCKTEVSQWEKPPEWVEWERRQIAAKFGTSSLDDGKHNDRSEQRVNNASPVRNATSSQNSSNDVDIDRLPHLLVEIAERHKIDLADPSALEKIKQHLKSALQEPVNAGSLAENHEAISDEEEVEEETKDSFHEQVAHGSEIAVAPETQENMDSTDCCQNQQHVEEEPPLATLSDSHALFYTEKMTMHIRDWAASHFENQAHNLSERSFQMSLEVAQVSADLKCARSLVRTAEIRSTLLDQRISYLRKQYYQLEALSKPSSSSSVLSHT